MKTATLTLLLLVALALSPAALPGASAARAFSRRSLQQIPGRPMTKPWFGGPNTGSPVGAVPLAAQPAAQPASTRPAVDPVPAAVGGDWNTGDAADDVGPAAADLEAVPTSAVPAETVPVTTVPIQATGPGAKPVPATIVPAVAPQQPVVAARPAVLPAVTTDPAPLPNSQQGFYGGDGPAWTGGAGTAMNAPADIDDGDIVTAAGGLPGGPAGITAPLADGAGIPAIAGWNGANKKGNKKGNNQWGGNNGNGNGWGAGGKPWKNNKGNRQALDPLVGPVNNYPSIRPQPIPVSGPAGPLSQGIFKKGNARSAAQSLAQAYSSGQVDAAAQAFANAATTANGGASSANAVADVFTEAVKMHPTVAPGLLAKSANLAVTAGQTNAFAATMADAFTFAKQKNCVPAFTNTVADAIATGGASSRYAFGEAISQAIAGGADSQAAVAEATAAAFCSGGDTASAWASAYAVALSKDSSGCLVLNQAKALAQSSCANQMSQSYADSQATSMVLGFCGLLDMVNINTNFAGGNSGSNTAGLGGFPAGFQQQPQYFTSGR